MFYIVLFCVSEQSVHKHFPPGSLVMTMILKLNISCCLKYKILQFSRKPVASSSSTEMEEILAEPLSRQPAGRGSAGADRNQFGPVTSDGPAAA